MVSVRLSTSEGLCGQYRRRGGDQFSEFPQVLGGRGEQELVVCAAGTAEPQSIEPEDAFEVGKAHFNLLALSREIR